jgi:hypothetical protein
VRGESLTEGNKMKTKYMVMVKDQRGELEVQTVLDSKEDAEFYAKQYSNYKDQYIYKVTCLKVVRG